MKNLLVICSFIFSTALFSQEQLGLRLENYAGINGVVLNPASNLTNPLRIDINLVSAGFFVENNYLFIKNTNTSDLLKNGSGAEFYNLPDFTENDLPTDGYVTDYFDDSRKRQATVLTNVMGPSFAFKIGDQHSVGLFTAARQMFSTQDIPNEFSYYKYDEIPLQEEFQVAPFVGTLMAWSEVGLNYAYKMPTADGSFGLGINVRFLQGYEGLYFKNDRTAGYTKEGGSLVDFDTPQISFGFTSSNLDYEEDFNLQKNGNGFATDIGAVWTYEGYDDGYILKLSASLIDIGAIKFKQNAESHQVSVDNVVDVDGDVYNDLPEGQEVEAAVEIFSTQTLGNPTASLQSDNFTIALPAAFTLQADYAITPNVFINGTLVQRVPFGKVKSKRSNILAATPRFEHRWLSASLPLILYNWQDFRVGLNARLGYLIIGTDNLGSWIGKSDYTGTDIYAGLKINFSELNIGGNSSHGRKRRRNGKVKCYF